MPVPTESDPLDGSSGTLADLVFDRLADLIISGRLAQGEILRDKDIAQWLAVSRTPVREAINRLIHIGLVESEPSRFTRVTKVDPNMIQKTFEFTGYMAGISVRMAMANMDQAQTDQAIALLDSMLEVSDVDDSDALYVRTRKFVGFMVRNSGNPVFVRAMRETAVAADRNLRHLRPQMRNAVERHGYYQQLRLALIANDPDLAEDAMRKQHRIH